MFTLCSDHVGLSASTWALIPLVKYLLYLNAIMCEKGKIFVSLLLQNDSIMSVSDLTWHLNEACPIKFDNVKLNAW